MFSIKDKVTVITGAASGIGLAAARHFAGQGARVVMADIADAGAAAGEIGATYLRCDVRSAAEVDQLFNAVLRQQGRLDVLVNNAAVQPLFSPIAETADTLLDQVLDVNIRGVFHGVKLGATRMRDGGRIINVASWLGQRGTAGSAIYGSSKAFVIHFSKVAAAELAPRGITVNALCPGLVMTPAMPPQVEPLVRQVAPLGRAAEMAEIVAALHYLASDESAYMTGTALTIDGGKSIGFGQSMLNAAALAAAGSAA
ncbi:MAG TPA: SDR family oxidoreductase [Azospirillaceae bacterium]|nr:SDR family oxidoreductase [Azospirillaceae bacterium]